MIKLAAQLKHVMRNHTRSLSCAPSSPSAPCLVSLRTSAAIAGLYASPAPKTSPSNALSFHALKFFIQQKVPPVVPALLVHRAHVLATMVLRLVFAPALVVAEVPLFGFGVGNLPHEHLEPLVTAAVADYGVRLVDTASASQNERQLGEVLATLGAAGAETQVLSKVWYTHLGFGRTRLSVADSLAALQRPVLDVALLHWPACRDDVPWMRCAEEEEALPARVKAAGPSPLELRDVPGREPWRDSWRALEAAQREGQVQHIGVSNFDLGQLRELLAFATVPPALLQGNVWAVVFDPHLMRFLVEHKILFQAYGALSGVLPSLAPPPDSTVQRARSAAAMAELEELRAVVSDRGRQLLTVPMLLLRWLMQQGVAVIPRSASVSHLEENAEAAAAASNPDTQLFPDEVKQVRSAVEGLLRASNGMPPRAGAKDEL